MPGPAPPSYPAPRYAVRAYSQRTTLRALPVFHSPKGYRAPTTSDLCQELLTRSKGDRTLLHGPRPMNTTTNTTMKKLLIIALTVLTVAAQAQDTQKERKSAQERAQLQTDRMTKELGLVEDQAAKVAAINLKYAEQAEALRAERQAQMEAMRKQEKGKAMREAHEAELKGVLSAEQFKQWHAKKEEAKAKHMEKRKEMRLERKN